MYNTPAFYPQQKTYFLLDTCFWRVSAIIIYLIYPIKYSIIWVYKVENEMKQKLLDLQIMLSIKRFNDWIKKSRKGDSISYYRGFLFNPWEQKLSPTMSVTNIHKLCRHVYNAHLDVEIALVQRRHDNMDYEYIAQRT